MGRVLFGAAILVTNIWRRAILALSCFGASAETDKCVYIKWIKT